VFTSQRRKNRIFKEDAPIPQKVECVKVKAELAFTKMSGAGNDFVVIDNRRLSLKYNWSDLAKSICRRRLGVGADGLIIIDVSSQSQFLMRYYNADGSSGGMCGNGGRCVAMYVMQQDGSSTVRFEALDYIYEASRQGSAVSLRMKNPTRFRFGVLVTVGERRIKVDSVDTGAPHTVVFLDDVPVALRRELEEHGIIAAGKAIRNDVAFLPGGTNADFVRLLQGSRISMRTYERGVEDETLACGTGAIASAILASRRYGLQSPVEVQTRGGEILSVAFEGSDDLFSNIELRGSAAIVFEGRIDVGALQD